MNRKQYWENIYQHKLPTELSWYQVNPIMSLELITGCATSQATKIIDVGGGASTLCDYLLEKGYQALTVVDISAKALEQAKQRLADKAELIRWCVADITNFSTSTSYDIWHDRAVFHFLTELSDRNKYKAVLNASVKVGGYIIIAAFAIGGATQCSGLPIVQYDATTLKNELGHNFSLIAQRLENHITPSGNRQLFGYYVLLKNA